MTSPTQEWEPEGWELPHLMSFATNESGTYIAVHADLAGITALIDALEVVREQLALDDCPHIHLFSTDAGGNELTTTKLVDQESEVNIVHHVKIYDWNREWALRHGLVSSPSDT